jgi:arylsulfatase A-like enzyme
VPKGTLPLARTVDLAPTILQLLDRPIPPGLDGAPLLPEGPASGTKASE